MDIYEKLDKYTKYSFGEIKEECELVYEDVQLEKIDFSEYDLNNSTFVGVTFSNCNFTGVYMSGSFFGGSILEECVLKGNILKKAQWDYVTFKKSNIEELDAFRTDFLKANFKDIEIINGKLIKCVMISAKFENVKFINCDLSDTTFKKSKMENVIFENCVFNNTRLHESFFCDNVKFRNIVVIEGNIKKIFSGNEIIEYLIGE